MQTAAKVGIGAGVAAVVGGGVYYVKYYRLPNMAGYQRLLLGASEWGISACQVRNPSTVITTSAAAKLCGTVYLHLGAARTRSGAVFTPTTGPHADQAQYAVVPIHRSSSNAAWIIGKPYLSNTHNVAGDFTGGTACS